MEILDLKDVISKKENEIHISTPRQMAPVYTLGDSYKRWFDRRFGSHYIELFVDDITLIKPVNEVYDALYIEDEIFGDITVESIEFKEDKGCYFVRLSANKIAIVSRTVKIT